MEIQSIITELSSKLGGNFDVTKVTELLKGVDTSKLSINEIIEIVKTKGLLGDLDGDGVKESTLDELKGKIGSFFG